MPRTRGGSWVWCFSREPVGLDSHSNIIPVELPARKFYPSVVWKIVTKKKKYDEIFVGEESLGRILEKLFFLHKAKVSYY